MHDEDIICQLVRAAAEAEDQSYGNMLVRAATYMEEQNNTIQQLIDRSDVLFQRISDCEACK